MGGKSHVIAPLADSRGNRTATQSLTQLIIINQAQRLTYAPPFQSSLTGAPSFSSLDFTCSSCSSFHSLHPREQQEIQDEVINYIPHCSSVTTHNSPKVR